MLSPLRLLILFFFSIVVSGQALRPPTLLTQGGTNRAIAVESPTYKTEPFALTSTFGGSLQIIVFADGLTDSLGLSAAGELNGAVYSFTVVRVQPVPECPSLNYVALAVPNLPDDSGDLHVWVTSHGLASNRVRVGFGHVGGGTPDTDCEPTFIVFVGNSLTAGIGASSLEHFYPTQAMNEIGCAWEFVNLGISGQTTPEMEARAAVSVDPLIRPGVRNILVVWEGSNHMALAGGFASPEDAYLHLKQYCLARRAAGWKVIILTVLPRSGLGVFSADWFEERRGLLNGLIGANWQSFADGFANVGNEITIGQPGDQFGPLFADDHTHLKDAGYVVPANYVRVAILALPAP
jgi:lysophospholipase L1-like esterase